MNREKSKNEDIFNLNLIDEKDYYLTDKSENNNDPKNLSKPQESSSELSDHERKRHKKKSKKKHKHKKSEKKKKSKKSKHSDSSLDKSKDSSKLNESQTKNGNTLIMKKYSNLMVSYIHWILLSFYPFGSIILL